MKKILVIRFSSLGDIVLTIPVYKNLKRSLKDCHIAAAVKEKYANVLAGCPEIDELLILGENEPLITFIGRVRGKHFDILIDLHNNLRSNFVAAFAGIPRVIRYKKAAWARRLFVAQRVKNPELQRHTVDRYLETLKDLGIQPHSDPPEINLQTNFFSDENRKMQTDAKLRLLVVQTAFLGDAVLTLPVFERLKAAYPSSEISLLCTPEIREVFSGNKNIDELFVMDKRGRDKGLVSLFHWAKKLRNRFDIAILPHRSFRSAFLIWLAGIPKRIGFNISQGQFFLTDTVRFDWGTHDAERNMKLLEALGIHPQHPEIKLPALESEFDFKKFSETHHIEEKDLLIGMNPGSVWKTKRWLPERFAEVADQLIEKYRCRVLLFGSQKDAEAVNAVQKAMKNPPVNLCGKTDLKTLAHIISRCSLFVTNDSGPMHLACAAKVPVVAVFGPTTKELGFFPYSEKSAVIELDLPCRPCTLHGGEKCPLEHFKCMKNITAEMVLKPCIQFLSEKAAQPMK